jgi:hypothetical protein
MLKTLIPKSVLVGLIASLFAACAQEPAQHQQVAQSSLVTAANETAAMARLRAIAVAEAQYLAESGDEYGTLDQLIEKRYVNDPSRGKLTGYRFEVQVKRGGFQITAVPEKFPITGKRSFYIDETNVIRGADKRGAPATASDPEV